MGHEILLALIREIDQANGERVSSNAVIYRLLPLNVALGAGGISTFNMPRIEMPVEARMSFYRLHDVQCSRLSAQGGWSRYKCGYRVSADVEGIVGAQGLFSQRMTDVFEFSGGRWRSPSMQERLRQVSVLTWGDIADNVNRGLGAASCIGAAFGGIVDTSCY